MREIEQLLVCKKVKKKSRNRQVIEMTGALEIKT